MGLFIALTNYDVLSIYDNSMWRREAIRNHTWILDIKWSSYMEKKCAWLKSMHSIKKKYIYKK
jgi:hypothetical protein